MASGVVAMSGTAVSHGAMDDKPANTAQEIAEQQGCPTVNMITMIKCLQKASAESIIRVSNFSTSSVIRKTLNTLRCTPRKLLYSKGPFLHTF